MDRAFTPDRRTLLAGAAVGTLGSIVLAGCGSDDSSSSGSGGSGSTAAPSAGGSGGGSGQTVASLDSIPDGQTVSVDNPNGGKLLLTRTGSTVTALSAKCTHQGCTVAPKNDVLQCPCHGSRFQPGTGAVLNGPASAPLSKVPVTVTGNQVTLT
jgi:nitrite reductase/ring-hydroxylating ferredoxin subunit